MKKKLLDLWYCWWYLKIYRFYTNKNDNIHKIKLKKSDDHTNIDNIE